MFPKSFQRNGLLRGVTAPVLCLGMWLCGCSKNLYGSSPPASAPDVDADDLFSSEAPMEVNVSQTFVDREGKLHVKVLLKPKVELPTADLAVTLVGLKDGVPQIEETKRVTEVYSEPVVAKDSLIAVQFELVPPVVSEFQVRASWGDEGREAVTKAAVAAKSAPVVAPAAATPVDVGAEFTAENLTSPAIPGASPPSGIVLTQLRTEEKKVSCDDGCDRELTVVVELRNNSLGLIQGATLGVRLIWINEGEDAPAATAGSLRPDEEAVEIPSLSLAPGQKRQIRVAIDRQLPNVAGGAFVPLVRLVQRAS